MRTAFGIVLLASAWCANASAETPLLQTAIGNPDNLKLSGSVRARYETLDGQPRAGLPLEDEQLDLRSTLFAEYRAGDVRFGAELYDSRAWLDRPGSPISANEVNTFELVQAYVAADVKDAFGEGSKATLQAGRFVMNLGSRRLVAADEYRNTTNGYTGLRGDVRLSDGTNVTAFYVLPQVRLPDDLPSVLAQKTEWDRESFDLQLWGALLARPKTFGSVTAELGYIGFLERDAPGRPTRDRHLQSFSARVIRDPQPGHWDVEGEGIFQVGTVSESTAANAKRLDVRAWFVHGEAGYTFDDPAKLRLAVEFDRASGDRPGGKYGRFDTLFGMRRADLAPAGIYNAIGRANIAAVGIRAEIAPSSRWDAFAAYRPMWLASDTDAFSTTNVRDPSGSSGSFAGQQLEGRVRYWLVPNLLRAEVNALWLAKGRFLKTAPNSPTPADTLYGASSITLTF